MKSALAAVSTLDCVLSRSLVAAERTRTLENDIILHFRSALDRISRFYRTTADVISQSVIEPAAITIAVDGKLLHCPRLLIQCRRRNSVAPRPLTFIYTPENASRITLQIAYGHSAYEPPGAIQWSSVQNDWCIPELDRELDSETHASFVRKALHQSALFSTATMTLESMEPETQKS